jgi:hypothetical protein
LKNKLRNKVILRVISREKSKKNRDIKKYYQKLKLKAMNLFGKKTEVSKTGVYTINGKNVTPLNELPMNDSYNGISESLGFPSYHGVFTFESNKIAYIAFKKYTKEPIWVEVKDKTQSLSYTDVTKIIQEIDWSFEWSQLAFRDDNE